MQVQLKGKEVYPAMYVYTFYDQTWRKLLHSHDNEKKFKMKNLWPKITIWYLIFPSDCSLEAWTESQPPDKVVPDLVPEDQQDRETSV